MVSLNQMAEGMMCSRGMHATWSCVQFLSAWAASPERQSWLQFLFHCSLLYIRGLRVAVTVLIKTHTKGTLASPFCHLWAAVPHHKGTARLALRDLNFCPCHEEVLFHSVHHFTGPILLKFIEWIKMWNMTISQTPNTSFWRSLVVTSPDLMCLFMLPSQKQGKLPKYQTL